MLFKELDKKTQEIFLRYNKERFSRYTLKEIDSNNFYLEKVDFALSQLDDDLVALLKMEYIDKSSKNWWMLYYSRTTYYRIKRKAMEELLACLK